MSISKFNLNKMREAVSKEKRVMSLTVLDLQRANPKDRIMRSVLRKETVSREDFNKGKVNAGVIFLSESFLKSADELAARTKRGAATLTKGEVKTLASYSYYVQLPDQEENFRESSFYVEYEGNKSPKRMVFGRTFQDFVDHLNSLYKNGASWQKKFTVVNGVPDSPYYIPIETEVAIPMNSTTLPLGFSFDPTLDVVRVYYVITGDVMFGYVYDDAEEALKSRYIHTAMLDWALPPERLAAMYQKWYGSPKVYDEVFRELHKQKFGDYPQFIVSTPALTAGGEVLCRAFPDWRNQRVIRDTILSNFSGLSGIVGNSDFTWELQRKMVEGQRNNILNGLKSNLFDKMDIYAVKNKSQFNNIPLPPKYIQSILDKITK